MQKAMANYDWLPSVGQKRVLNIGKSFPGNRDNYDKTFYDNSSDGVWKTKARNKPLIGLTDVMADVPTMRHNWGRGLLDWSATNFIAVVIGSSIVMFDGSSKNAISRPGRVLEDVTTNRRSIKWNNAGTLLAICTKDSKLLIHHLEHEKLVWSRTCRCTVEEPRVACQIFCAAWTQTDAQIVVGCSEGRLTSYKTSLGEMIDTVYVHADVIIAVAFSPNDRYLVSTSMDKAVRVHTWPSLTPYLTIGYYEPVQAMAWHPWETDMLCVGGGFEDGSLSLWDIHRQTSLGYRKIPFLGVVKNMTWNKLSGELVVQWNYLWENSARAIVPVLASLDRIVDLVATAPRIMDLVWKPDGTQLALRMKNSVKIWNFFGNETSKWHDEEKEKKLLKAKSVMSAGRTIRFGNYCIR